MKICICTTPIRPIQTEFPPFGSMAIIQSLRSIGEDVSFYNLDYFRPAWKEIEMYFSENKFGMVGISAVVSTAYAYTKDLAALIRLVSPDTIIVVGGGLAASSEILLRKCEIDFCVDGDGENIIQDLVQALSDGPRTVDCFKEIKGICFMDGDRFHFTGHGTAPSAEEIAWPDFSILEADNSLPHFISDDLSVFYDRLSPEQSQGKNVATVIATKGCVARCTFCHRWIKGYKAKPADAVIDHIRSLKETYGVGLVSISDENFGSDKDMTRDLVTQLGDMGIIWRGAGVRARTVDADTLRFWKENGCEIVFFGIESGSQRMLDVMEKNVTVQQNIDALRWTHEAGLFTIIQLVLAMPGENDQTIGETIDFLKTVTPYLFLDGKLPSSLISENYAHALPGTPLFEWAREHGFIGNSIDKEEDYLLAISDTDAYGTDHFLNYTGLPLLKVLTWRYRLTGDVDAHYLRSLGVSMSLLQVMWFFVHWLIKKRSDKMWVVGQISKFIPQSWLAKDLISKQMDASEKFDRSGYFNIKPSWAVPLFLNGLTCRFYYPLLAAFTAEKHGKSVSESLGLITEHLWWSLKRLFAKTDHMPEMSLRKVVNVKPSSTISPDEEDLMLPLRLGR